MRTVLLVLLLAALPLAGCMGGGDEVPAEEAPVSPTVQVGDRPEPTFSDIQLGTVAAPDANATLLEAPRLREGEWWKIHMTSPLTGAEATFIRVVAKVEGDAYVVGMPHEGWYKEAVIYHTPAFGDIGGDLSYRAHNIPFQPVKFPLTDGATWTTQFERPPDLTATVKVDSPTEATVTFTDPEGNERVKLVYDATIHEVREFAHSTVVYEVIEHGYDFEGWITVPRGEHLFFEHGRVLAPVVGFDLTPASPAESVEVSGGYNRMSFILAVGNVIGPGVGGAYKETVTAPDGTEYSLESIPGQPLTIEFFEHADPDGVWQLQHIAAGPGIAFVEGIAYHQYDIHLPSRNVRSDHSHEVVR